MKIILLLPTLFLMFLIPYCITGKESQPEVIPLKYNNSFFVKNVGQYPEDVLYCSDISGGRLWVKKDGIVISLIEPKKKPEPNFPLFNERPINRRLEQCEQERVISNVFVRFEGMTFSEILPEDEQVTKINIFKGNDSSKWHSNIPTFSRIRISDSSNNVQLALDTKADNGVLWNFEGNVHKPKMTLETANNVMESTEKIEIMTPFGNFVFWVAEKKNNFSENHANFDSNQSLLWGTYLGGSSDDFGTRLILDSAGVLILGGYTASLDIPTPNGYSQTKADEYDIYLAKMSADGSSLLWGTYLGGSGDESLSAFSMDSSGNIVIAGSTTSADFPAINGFDVSHNGNSDIYIAKLTADGSSLSWGTYIGGSGDEFDVQIGLDSSDNIVFGCTTFSGNMPATEGYDTNLGGEDDMFLGKLSKNGLSLLWGTYVGGSSEDIFSGLKVTSNDNIVFGGYSFSEDLPYDSIISPPVNLYPYFYLSKMTGDGLPIWRVKGPFIFGANNGWSSFYLGYILAIDASENIIIAGSTSFGLPTPNGYDKSYNGCECCDRFCTDIYVAKLSKDGSSLLWGTYLGGSLRDSVYAVNFDSFDNIFIGGITESNNIPVPGGFQQTLNGQADMYMAKLSKNGSMLYWGTYFGGSANGDEWISCLKRDLSGNIYFIGSTFSLDIPVLNGFNATYNGGLSDIYVGKITDPYPCGNCPLINSLVKKQDPFRIVVTGGSFDQGIQVYIGDDNTPWEKVTRKSLDKIVIKGGKELKVKVPKDTATTFRFVNPDGGETTLSWQWP
ncbi:MAG TPA: hypothetical protein PKJ37_10200 [Acidobacteriota bacterium]|jgi:hypothetical protein|nr:hypothetical protein [Acidobacteriota bacterium]HNT18249.1 hypothetical protein [Acidobacteriota bacterium]